MSGVIALVFALVACSSSGAGDAGAMGEDGPAPDADCPAGWYAGPEGCDPWPEPGKEDCPDGFAHFVSTAGCEPLGAPCPDGPFPEDTPATAVFVDPGAAGMGPGTRDSPMSNLAFALMRAMPGAEVIVARGTHEPGQLSIPPGVTLRGACAAETVLLVQDQSVHLFGEGSTITEVTVRSSLQSVPILTMGSTGRVRVVSVQIDGEARPEERTPMSFSGGVATLGAMGELVLERVRIRGKIAAVRGVGAGAITLDQVDIEDAEFGVWAQGVLGPTEIRDTSIDASEVGVALTDHGRVTVERSYSRGVIALMPAGPGHVLREVSVAATEGEMAFDFPAVTMLASAASDLSLERLWVGPARNAGIHLEGPIDVDATGVKIHDVDGAQSVPIEGLGWGSGLVVMDGASLTMTDFVIQRAALCGLHIAEGGEMDVMNGEVSSSTIGACVSDPDYDVDRLRSEVRYSDNGNNLDTRGLPVPEVDISLLRP